MSDMSEQRTSNRGSADVVALRVEEPNGWMEDHFCARCTCTKSGWADVPNMVAEWCQDPHCPCHEEDG